MLKVFRTVAEFLHDIELNLNTEPRHNSSIKQKKHVKRSVITQLKQLFIIGLDRVRAPPRTPAVPDSLFRHKKLSKILLSVLFILKVPQFLAIQKIRLNRFTNFITPTQATQFDFLKMLKKYDFTRKFFYFCRKNRLSPCGDVGKNCQSGRGKGF